jgi:hypothetical protein
LFLDAVFSVHDVLKRRFQVCLGVTHIESLARICDRRLQQSGHTL